VKRVNRPLAVIAEAINVALKRETAAIFAIGGLLIEAKEQIEHGHWYSWLEKNFSLSRQSADRYIRLHKALLKTPNIGELKIRSTLLDVLLLLPPKRRFPPQVEAAILKEAETKWVGLTRAYEIAREIKRAEALESPPWEEEEQEPEPDELEQDGEPEQDEPEQEPPPDLLPPPPAPLPRDEFLSKTFANAIRSLKELMTKPSSKFIQAAEPEELEVVANFLNQIAAESRKSRTNRCCEGLSIPDDPSIPLGSRAAVASSMGARRP
jgi:hypothetical protein